MKPILFITFSLGALVFQLSGCDSANKQELQRPNILIAISDDQSFGHTSFAGSKFVNTPAFDRVAREGIFFTNCFASSPGCASSRGSLVTGRHHWQNEQSGQHASSWMKKYVPFVDLLDANGYSTGRTGKGVSPFQYARDENDSLWRATNAAGIAHSNINYEKGTPDDERPAEGISPVNYFENFKYFMENVKGDKPFFFWYGAKEPHRAYEKDSWKRAGKKLEDVEVPPFLPDNDIIRGDLLDYAVEIEWFDLHLERMINYLEEIGELDNTIIIVTSDNGMPFLHAKTTCYEYGIHVPLAIRFPRQIHRERVVDDLISFIDFAPTILEFTRTEPEGMLPITGKSLMNLLTSKKEGTVEKEESFVFAGRERHSSARYLNRGYPQRAVRSNDHLFIWNMKPDRWPVGSPQRIDTGTGNLFPMYGIDNNGEYHPGNAYTDIAEGPTKTFVLKNRNDEAVNPFFVQTFMKKPEFELFNIKEDPFCLNNLINNPELMDIKQEMKNILDQELTKTKDPRIVGPDKEIFDSYKRYGLVKEFIEPSGN